MNSNSNDKNHPQPAESPNSPIPEELKKAVQSYADAVNSDQPEKADQAAITTLMLAGAEAVAHPTPELQLAGEADDLLHAGDWARTEDAYRRLIAMQEQTGNPGLVAKPQMDLSRLFCLLGRFEEARAYAEAATASARRIDLYPLLAMVLEHEAACALARGDTTRALAAASEAVQVIEPGKIADLMRAQAHTIRAQCLLASGDAEAAERDLQAAGQSLESQRARRIGTGPVVALAKWCGVQAQLEARKGNFEAAQTTLKQAIEYRREGFNRSCNPTPHAFAALARDFEALAEIRKKTGDLPGQQAALVEAKAIWEQIHLPAAG